MFEALGRAIPWARATSLIRAGPEASMYRTLICGSVRSLSITKASGSIRPVVAIDSDSSAILATNSCCPAKCSPPQSGYLCIISMAAISSSVKALYMTIASNLPHLGAWPDRRRSDGCLGIAIPLGATQD